MKKTILAILTFAFGAGLVQAGVPTQKVIPVTHVFVPSGFDSNDNSEIIITGFLPNLCHKTPKANAMVTGNKIDILLTSLYYDESNPFCPEMVVPFTETLELGVLDKGKYEVTVNGKSIYKKEAKLKVNESTSAAIDDFSYAYVEHIDKESARDGHVILKGYNPSDCFELDSIEYISNGKDTYSILPKMKQVRAHCPMKLVPFEYEWKVPSDIDRNEVLLHVRTLEGRSKNTLFYR